MADASSELSTWTPEQLAQGRRWVDAWKQAGPELEQIRRKELRVLNVLRAIEGLCFEANYHVPPRAPKDTSGLVEQQYWFMKAAGRA